MEVGINKVNCDIIFAKCSCPAGESGYCNHIMALLFEIADYSLHQLISTPEQKASPMREIRHHRKNYACVNYCSENKHYDLPFSLQLYE